MKVERSSSVEERKELILDLVENIAYLESYYSRIAQGPKSDEADLVIGAIGLSMKNLRMAKNILTSLKKRSYEFRQYERSDHPSAWNDEKQG